MSNEDAQFIKQIIVAAEGGDSASQARLALMYMEGFGTGPDVRLAKDWYTKSANQHDPDGHYGLACLEIFGLAGSRDLVEAYMRLMLMNMRRQILSKRWRKDTYNQMMETFTSLGTKLGEPQKTEARRRAETWLARKGL